MASAQHINVDRQGRSQTQRLVACAALGALVLLAGCGGVSVQPPEDAARDFCHRLVIERLGDPPGLSFETPDEASVGVSLPSYSVFGYIEVEDEGSVVRTEYQCSVDLVAENRFVNPELTLFEGERTVLSPDDSRGTS